MYSNTVVIPSTKNLRSGPGPVPVRPQGPVHSPPGPGPTELGLVHPLTGPDTQTYGLVRSGPRSTRARTRPRTIYLCMKLQIPLRWAALVNLSFANDVMHHLRAEHSSSPCETGIMEIGLINMYVQDAVGTTSENLRLPNTSGKFRIYLLQLICA